MARAADTASASAAPEGEVRIAPLESDPDRASVAIGGGEAVLYCRRSPMKETDNEDTAALIPYGPAAAVLAVADGAGGMPAGRRASRTAIETLGESLARSMEQTLLLRTAVLNAIEQANDAVIGLQNGSATTLSVVTVEGRLARSYHIGDSAAVVTGQRGKLKLQTVPHSPVGFAVEAGFLGEREALYHAERNVVSNFLGTPEMRIEVGAELELAPFDTVLVASDGLTDNLHLDEIVERMRAGPLDAALDRLVELASRRMSALRESEPCKPDDLTVILFRKPKPAGDGEARAA